MNGIDVSHYQGTIDYKKVKTAGINFVYIKVTEGLHTIDSEWTQNFDGATAAGLYTGLYHFGHPSEDPIQQAEFFYDTAKRYGLGELPLILDVETTDNVNIDIDAWSVEFLTHLEQISNHDVGVYSSEWFATTYLKQAMSVCKFTWIAKYSTVTPALKYAIWQQSQSGHVDGVPANVDIDTGVDLVLSQTVNPQYELFDVVVNNSIYAAFSAMGSTFVLYTALDEFNTPHTYKGNGLMDVNGVDVQGIIYSGTTYLPWTAIASGIKSTPVKWFFHK